MPVNDVASMANLFNQLGVALAGSDDEPGVLCAVMYGSDLVPRSRSAKSCMSQAIAALQEGLKHKDGAHTELVVNLSMLYRYDRSVSHCFHGLR